MSIKYLIGKKVEIIEYKDCTNIECDGCDDYEECENERLEIYRFNGIILDARYCTSKDNDDGLVLNVAVLLDDGEVFSWHITNDTNMILGGDDAQKLTNRLLNYVPEDEVPTGREHLLDFEE